ncbi:hypothetical protein BDF14DRAFT_1859893 [Spinellus fusiger]|nr:hypothetical protein BDF14DRAFT_1859893 [Spinellus fusiger]
MILYTLDFSFVYLKGIFFLPLYRSIIIIFYYGSILSLLKTLYFFILFSFSTMIQSSLSKDSLGYCLVQISLRV